MGFLAAVAGLVVVVLDSSLEVERESGWQLGLSTPQVRVGRKGSIPSRRTIRPFLSRVSEDDSLFFLFSLLELEEGAVFRQSLCLEGGSFRRTFGLTLEVEEFEHAVLGVSALVVSVETEAFENVEVGVRVLFRGALVLSVETETFGDDAAVGVHEEGLRVVRRTSSLAALDAAA